MTVSRFCCFSATLLMLMGSAAAQNQQKNVVYAEAHGAALVMDIFTPTGDRNGLAIIDVISGGWSSDRGKIRDHALTRVFNTMCGRGYTVFAIRPGSASRFTIPDMVKHMELGIRWVKDHAEEYEIDPTRLGLMGASAGGHLASMVAVTNGSSDTNPGIDQASVKAVAVFFPPTDMVHFLEQAGSERVADRVRTIAYSIALREGKAVAPEEIDVKKVLTSISPARLVTEKAPPFLLIHGTADELVPQEQSEILLAALKEKGVPAELILKEGGGHPWPTIHEEVAVFADYFDEHLGNQP